MKVQISAHSKRKNVSVITYYSAGIGLGDAEKTLLLACFGDCVPRHESEFDVVTYEVRNYDLASRVRALVALGFKIEIR